MTQPVNSYVIGDTTSYSITALMQTAEIQRRGHMQYQMLNYANTGEPGLSGYAGFNLNGSLYFIAEAQEAVYRSSTTYSDISNAPTGNYYLFVNGSGSDFTVFAATVTSTAITYDVALAGWVEQYTQNYLIGGFTVSTAAVYSLKWIIDPKSTVAINRIYATGYDLPVYRLTGASYIGEKWSFSLSSEASVALTIHYPCLLSLDVSTNNNGLASGNLSNVPTFSQYTGNQYEEHSGTYAVGVVIAETDTSNVTREYMPKTFYENCYFKLVNMGNGVFAWTMTNAYASKNITISLMPGTYTLTSYNATASGKIRNTFGTNKIAEY